MIHTEGRLPWWHRRVVVISDDEAWAAAASEAVLSLNGQPEILDWPRAATVEGPVGAVLAHACSDDDSVESALLRWAEWAWQPLTLVWLPPVRGAAKRAHVLAQLRYVRCFDSTSSPVPRGGPQSELARIVDRGGWIVPRFASALGWSTDPFLVHVLSLPTLSEDAPASVKAWRWVTGKMSYAEFEKLFRLHGAPPPKQVLDRLRIAGATVWAVSQRRPPERRRLASHLGYSSGGYLGRRVKQLSGFTLGELRRMPVDDGVEALTRRLRKPGPAPPPPA